MQADLYEKLALGVQRTLSQAGTVPPIIVRPVEEDEHDYEIIDGEHRWRVFNDIGEEEIPICVLRNITEADARLLTLNLNYLRGTAGIDEYTETIYQIASEGMHLDEIASLVPESREELDELLALFDKEVDLSSIEDLLPEGDDVDESGFNEERATEEHIVLRWRVPREIALVVQSELDRIKDFLRKGGSQKGLDLQALEIMAVNSANTPVQQFTGE